MCENKTLDKYKQILYLRGQHAFKHFNFGGQEILKTQPLGKTSVVMSRGKGTKSKESDDNIRPYDNPC